ncbi:lycopene beta-cyclase [Sphingomonas vulcanisoli]|uniref:Lycopene beta-cyclase n=1 Tax=Sphingomonas vulcanisoli TaxID=1658060 RepID=A0ABX0TVT1_9SPHN|nr:lycopene beta-cyclase [Sphingomonas vulcanisoli]
MRPDILIIGGGLAAGLAAVAITQRRPGTTVMIVERGETLGGNHIWSFFQSDIAAEDWSLVAPFVSHRWEGSEVAFPGLRRALTGAYCSIESERFDAVLRTMLPPEAIRTGATVTALDRGGAMLADGSRIEAEAVIEARGLRDISALDCGWQKFAGRLLRLAHPHGLDRPMIMDATVDQSDGYRFVYVLPFSPTSVFVEDTYYTTGPEFDEAVLEARILDYARTRGWQVEGISRREAAALPIVTGGNFELMWRTGAQGIGKIGMAAALFHPVTGYSLPDAVRTAALIAGLKSLHAEPLQDALRKHAEARWTERRYYRLLSKLLFEAAAPPDRWRMLARFYSLKPALIARLYSAQSTKLDKARILCGKPPVPIGKAIKVISGGVS